MKLLPKMEAGSVDLIFADPPYFLSNDGITCKGGRMVSVNKADWDKSDGLKDIHSFNRKWIRRCYRVLKESGSIFISGTFHNIYSIGMALQQENFTIVNNITWQKLNPPPNLACKCFTHSTETVIWAVKNKKKYFFNYQLMKQINDGKQMKDVWSGTLTPQREKVHGKHPTQKPEYLLERIILAASKEGDVVLDPFTGSSTTGVVAIRNGRKFIGIDNVEEYIDISQRRLDNEKL
jgi:site-specific DNA-methyltransferase (adenine-specific)